MTQREQINADIVERVLATDVAILNDHNVSDEVVSLMAAEHAARCETLSKMIEPTLGRALLLVTAGALISAAKQITDATVVEAELV
jgi:hypothetical protein